MIREAKISNVRLGKKMLVTTREGKGMQNDEFRDEDGEKDSEPDRERTDERKIQSARGRGRET